jgi:hypothetical protein
MDAKNRALSGSEDATRGSPDLSREIEKAPPGVRREPGRPAGLAIQRMEA